MSELEIISFELGQTGSVVQLNLRKVTFLVSHFCIFVQKVKEMLQ